MGVITIAGVLKKGLLGCHTSKCCVKIPLLMLFMVCLHIPSTSDQIEAENWTKTALCLSLKDHMIKSKSWKSLVLCFDTSLETFLCMFCHRKCDIKKADLFCEMYVWRNFDRTRDLRGGRPVFYHYTTLHTTPQICLNRI